MNSFPPRRWTRAAIYRAKSVHPGIDAPQYWAVMHPTEWLRALDTLLTENGSLTPKQSADFTAHTEALLKALTGLGLPLEPPVETEPHDPLLHGMRAA